MSQQPHLRPDLPHLISKLIQLTGLFCFTNTLVIAGLSCSHIPLPEPVCVAPSCVREIRAGVHEERVKLLAISADPVEANSDWIDDMEDFSGSRVEFPIIADAERKVATLYDMIDHQDATNLDDKGLQLTIRAVFIIDPSKKIRLIMTYLPRPVETPLKY